MNFLIVTDEYEKDMDILREELSVDIGAFKMRASRHSTIFENNVLRITLIPVYNITDNWLCGRRVNGIQINCPVNEELYHKLQCCVWRNGISVKYPVMSEIKIEENSQE